MENKEKEVNLSDADANFVIASFKNKDRRNNPSSIPRPQLPESTKEQPEEKELTGVPEKEQPLREETKRKRNKSIDYESLFIQELIGVAARSGKSVYIRKEHHDRILKIIQVIGKNEISLFSYLDNILSHHFDTFQSEIAELYNKNNKDDFFTLKK